MCNIKKWRKENGRSIKEKNTSFAITTRNHCAIYEPAWPTQEQ